MKAKAFIDVGDVIGRVSPMIYGQFIEHLGRCIYGGIWVGEDSPIPNVRGHRKDVLEAVKGIKPPIVRYPGGNFVSQYHFEDGLGPRNQRLVCWGLAWKVEEPNRFGTDEFVEWCRLVGTEPYICVNAGNGTPEEAAHWVEYCNRKGNTHYAKLRERYGHPEPYGVKWWGLGNELYGPWQIGHCLEGKECARRTLEFAKCMRNTDPSIQMIAVGCDNDQWNWDMVVGAGRWFQHLAYHTYIHERPLPDLLATSLQIEQKLNRVAATIEGARGAGKIEHPIKIAFDEWNVWYPSAKSPEHFQAPSLKDGLFTATTFNVFHRLCNVLSMCNLAQTVNVLPLIHTREGDRPAMFVNPQYLAFQLYVHHTGELCVRSRCQVDAYRSEMLKLDAPYLDLTATFTPGKAVFVHAVNRHPVEAIECDIEFRDAAPKSGTAHFLAAGSPDANNDFDRPKAVQLAQKRLRKVGPKFRHCFLPLSATVLELR